MSKQKIRRLYESDARGLLDEELLEDIGMQLCQRCEDILTVSESRRGRVRCPRCARRGQTQIIERARGKRAKDEILRCPECSWETTWESYRKTFQRKQMNDGGAGADFQAFIERYERARTPVEKMLAIDEVIHTFHVYLVRHTQTGECRSYPTRAACVNLIEGKLRDVVAFLDQLAYGEESHPRLRATRDSWRESIRKASDRWWDDWRITWTR